MQVQSILSPGRTRCDVAGVSKKRTLELLAHQITEDVPTLDADELFRSLINREKLGSTGLGHGIAIPHCRIANCATTLGALFKLEEPVDFDAIDGQPVDIVFALLVPEDAEEHHLQSLATLANLFSQDEFRDRLRDAKTDEDLYQLATQWAKVA